jgi:hypothetical protein
VRVDGEKRPWAAVGDGSSELYDTDRSMWPRIPGTLLRFPGVMQEDTDAGSLL